VVLRAAAGLVRQSGFQPVVRLAFGVSTIARVLDFPSFLQGALHVAICFRNGSRHRTPPSPWIRRFRLCQSRVEIVGFRYCRQAATLAFDQLFQGRSPFRLHRTFQLCRLLRKQVSPVFVTNQFRQVVAAFLYDLQLLDVLPVDKQQVQRPCWNT
jgi:hypothetical protein